MPFQFVCFGINGFAIRCITTLPSELLNAPILSQLTRGRCGEDGLAETLEQRRDAVEAVAASVDTREYAVELVDDAFLFGERWQVKGNCTKSIFANYALC